MLNLPGTAGDRFLHLPLIRDNDDLPCTSVPEIRQDDPLDAETAQNAIGVVRWFINAQLDILTRSRRQAAARVEEKVLKLLDENRQRQGRNFITAREVHRARITTTADAAKALLARMDADGLLHGEDIAPAHGGKTTRIYSAIRNPVPE